jgi:hypothetical protein
MQVRIQCEHCGHECEIGAYDDTYYHTTVLPARPCESCGKTAPPDGRVLAPRYPDGVQV